MISFLARHFIRDYRNTSNPAVRLAYGVLVSAIGILVNLLLAGGKLAAGVVSGSVAVTADAVNNLSDAGSAAVSLVCFRLAAKPADREHPFGHARMEYVASMVVAFLVLAVGVQLLRESVLGLAGPSRVTFDPLLAVVLAISIAGKVFLMLLNRVVGRRVDSTAMRAASTDSLADVLATSCVLVATVVARVAELPFNLDACMGMAVAGFILFSGGRILNETKNSILGKAPDRELVARILALVKQNPMTLGVHDLLVHSYGAGHVMASLHVEVDGRQDIFTIHEALDGMENALWEQLGVRATLHPDPIAVGDPKTEELRSLTQATVQALYPKAGMHDFRMVRGDGRYNLIFDLEIPFEEKKRDGEIARTVEDAIRKQRKDCAAIIHVDRE